VIIANLARRIAYAMNRVEARMQLVRAYQEAGSLRETARRWKISRHTMPSGYDATRRRVKAVSMIAAMPPILLDEISTDLVLAGDPETGNDLLARYIRTHWREEILNYFYFPVTNGFVEGKINPIKVIIRSGYGYRNLANLGLRILMTNHSASYAVAPC